MPERATPPASARRRLPGPVIELGRGVRRWRAKGPRLGNYQPRSTLEVPVHLRSAACVPAVNFHTHLGRWLSPEGTWMEPDVDALVAMMRSCNIKAIVNLDGRWGAELEENLDRYDRAHPGSFYTFCHVDWRLLDERDGSERLVQSLQKSVSAGARGLKVWKDLGTNVHAGGRLVMADDPALAPLWRAAGELGLPVLSHVVDPVAFFRPVDYHNERLEELLRYPQNSRQAGGTQEFDRLLHAFEQVVAAHPGTNFVAAHGYYPENLAHVGAMMDRYPNFHIDLAWVHLQLGRQPRAAAALINAHPDRVLFGTDVFPLRAEMLQTYFRFLETEDEAFAYTAEEPPGSGRWDISGLGLPGPVLSALYRDNALRLLNGA
ncbi:MAG TPA: amidohydrolase family protein [Acidimicrobiales bacterium]|nr:amidohydrolase family protein [Acidimicrobiales bacterium]